MLIARIIVLVAGLHVGGWWVFDGVHAMVRGDLVTPRSGQHAGQYGPWKHVVAAVGIDPRSRGMHVAFIVMGAAYLVVLAAWALGVPHAGWGVLAMAAFSLWYLPFGTVLGLVQIGVLVAFRRALLA